MPSNKVVDISPVRGSRADKTNISFFIRDYINNFKPLRYPATSFKERVSSLSELSDLILNKYKIRSIEYGNWVNQFRRIDFDLNFVVAMDDFEKVLNFKNNIGINKTLNVAFGARGFSKAYAHYEHYNRAINLTRDRRVDKLKDTFNIDITDKNAYKQVKEYARKELSGYGSFAHEYGHFLDYELAERYCPGRTTALTGGAIPIYSYSNPQKAYDHVYDAINASKSQIEESVLDIMTSILFKISSTGKISVTPYYKRLYDFGEKRGDYWLRTNEIWARFFEIYTAYKLHKKGIENLFLVRDKKGKYYSDPNVKPNSVYLTYNEMDKLYKKGDKFLQIASKLINKR